MTWLRDHLSKHRPEHVTWVVVAAVFAITGVWEALCLWPWAALGSFFVVFILIARVLSADPIQYHQGVPLSGVDADRAAKQAAEKFYERRQA